MLQLMKYEFRKTAFSKVVLLIITAAAELAFLLGVFFEWTTALAWGVTGLALCALIGIFYIGIESLIVFQRDLNTKQSYMLFLTPRSSYEILGAKTLENGLSILAAGVCFAGIAAIDAAVLMLYMGGFKEALNLLESFLQNFDIQIDIPAQTILMGFFSALAGWLMMVVTGFLAIVLSATVLAGKRFSGMAAFVLYGVINFAVTYLLDHLPVPSDQTTFYLLHIVVTLAVTAVLYAVTGWIMERKLSV